MSAKPRWIRWFGGLRRRPTLPERLWALDLEMTGLDERRDRILAVGMVPVRDDRVLWGERWYATVRHDTPALSAPDALRVHHLIPADARSSGVTMAEVFSAVTDRLGDAGVLLLHGAAIDLRFLRAEAARAEIAWHDPPVVDTLDFLKKLQRSSHMLKELDGVGPASLEEARRRFGLPDYPAHHALIDALATAELYLVLRRRYRDLHPKV